MKILKTIISFPLKTYNFDLAYTWTQDTHQLPSQTAERVQDEFRNYIVSKLLGE